MIRTVRQVHEDFFREINSHNITASVGKVPLVYYDKFNKTPTEIQRAQYPVMSLQNYRPKANDGWTDNMQEIYDGLGGYDDKGVPLTIQSFREPIYLDFRYDISVATKTQNDLDVICDQILKIYGTESEIFLDKTILPDGTIVGVPVWVKVEAEDIPRSDEIKEVNHEFTFSCFVDYKDPLVLEVIQNVNITLTQNGKN